MIGPKELDQPSQPQMPQFQNVMTPPAGYTRPSADARASMKNAESGIGASMIADLLKSELELLQTILSKLLQNMATPSPMPESGSPSAAPSSAAPSVADGSSAADDGSLSVGNEGDSTGGSVVAD